MILNDLLYVIKDKPVNLVDIATDNDIDIFPGEDIPSFLLDRFVVDIYPNSDILTIILGFNF